MRSASLDGRHDAAGPQAGRPAGEAEALAARAAVSRPQPDDDCGDPPCWMRRVCPACGALADADPPTVCPRCEALLPGD